MPSLEREVIRVTTDQSEEAAVLGGREVLDFSKIPHDPHEVAAGVIANLVKGALDNEGHRDPTHYEVRFAGPDKVTVSPPLSNAAKAAISGYFGAEMVSRRPVLEAVS